ncbi:hypothetical protein NDU88_000669 [Pleurodeles waltl]|uniref:Uncharacterized protein n=1 Tax=Pleurodeles waltl TaxID=8319 RepID=A0AAV7VU75_PLEWA|nr:hypothetical protein NDU88_000669 [Pleurodeles waltl]
MVVGAYGVQGSEHRSRQTADATTLVGFPAFLLTSRPEAQHRTSASHCGIGLQQPASLHVGRRPGLTRCCSTQRCCTASRRSSVSIRTPYARGCLSSSCSGPRCPPPHLICRPDVCPAGNAAPDSAAAASPSACHGVKQAANRCDEGPGPSSRLVAARLRPLSKTSHQRLGRPKVRAQTHVAARAQHRSSLTPLRAPGSEQAGSQSPLSGRVWGLLKQCAGPRSHPNPVWRAPHAHGEHRGQQQNSQAAIHCPACGGPLSQSDATPQEAPGCSAEGDRFSKSDATPQEAPAPARPQHLKYILRKEGQLGQQTASGDCSRP